MKTYITLLRGINVSGKNIIKIEALKSLCTTLGLQNIKTYIQSGNIVYQTTTQDPHALSLKIHQTIRDNFGLNISILTMSSEQFEDIVNQNPYNTTDELSKLYISFINSPPQLNHLDSLNEKKADTELIHITTSAVYLVAAIGYGKTKITNTLIENKLKVTATTRNYKTCLKLIELSKT
ncbi:DUF1697 domain-containing protein [Myroides pelagicus]|uniref:DUF1697 domain-containing protein n=1 Tax=Myroides pelagicus TaxID=270914 RepID=A0A7K1GK71_9FLAO|nr:DUF1697 domain-containing protein [Myroides pelagicus]MEC4114732.1 DUF1697 domain-containing protein [Myroides pelagicus]MTH29285.1 DUF1697 domain-containing protein [Myroides pelagicus]